MNRPGNKSTTVRRRKHNINCPGKNQRQYDMQAGGVLTVPRVHVERKMGAVGCDIRLSKDRRGCRVGGIEAHHAGVQRRHTEAPWCAAACTHPTADAERDSIRRHTLQAFGATIHHMQRVHPSAKLVELVGQRGGTLLGC